MRAERCSDAVPINRILNHPAVFNTIAVYGFDNADTTPLIRPENAIFLVKDEGAPVGCFLLHQFVRDMYALHVAFLPGARGRRAATVVRDTINEFLRSHPLARVIADVPVMNRAAVGFARMLGGSFYGETENGFRAVDGSVCSTKHYLIAVGDRKWRG